MKKLEPHIKNYYTLSVLFFLLFLTFNLNFYSAQYATVNAGASLVDFFDFFADSNFSSLRDMAVGVHLYWTRLIFLSFLIYALLFFPKKMIQFLCLNIVLVIFRMVTTNLTYLGKVINQPVISGYDFTFGGDLFFSGHVAYTFLFYLVLRDTPIKYLVLFFHVVITLSTIIGRFHYAIDVIGAYAITYSLYKLTENYFKNK